MTIIVALLIAGLVLLFFEVILPGGILGVLAAICFIVATIIASQIYGLLIGGLIFLGALVLSMLVVYLEYRLLADKFALRSAITGRSRPEFDDDSLIGTTAETLTRLNPTGKIIVNGRSYEAYSQDGYLERGKAVTILSRDNYRLIIKKS